MGPASWLRPELLFGFLGLLIPPLIHLLGRKKRREVKIATLRFLERAVAKSSARWRLKRFLLLLSRLAALFFLAALFAGPGCESASGGAQRAVLVLDVSKSMEQEEGGATALARAVGELSALVSAASPESRFAVVTTARQPEGVADDDLFTQPEIALKKIESAATVQDDAGLSGALDRAFALAASGGGAGVVLATDMQRHAFRGVDYGKKPPADFWIMNAGPREPSNGWIKEVSQDGERVEVILGASGAVGGGKTVKLKTASGEELTAFVDNGRTNFTPELKNDFEELNLSLSPGASPSYDDRLSFVGASGGVSRVLIINGDPKTLEIEDETLFLRRALASGKKMEGRYDIRSLKVGELSAKELEKTDVAWLANPHGLPDGAREALLAKVRAGMGLVVSAGDGWELSQSPEALFDLLAAPVRFCVSPGDAGKTRPPYQELDRQGFSGALSQFSGGDLAAVSFARTRGYWMLDAGAQGGAQVLARLADQSPLVAERQEGKGKIVTLATSVDRDWSDLCLKPQFIPLVDRLLLHAAGKLKKEIPSYLVIGRDSLGPLAEPVTVVAPSGAKSNLMPGGAPFAPADAGFYSVQERGRVVGGFVARIDPAESDVTPLSEDEAKRLLPGAAVKGVDEGGRMGGRKDLSPLFGALLLAALICEALLSGRFSRAPVFSGIDSAKGGA